MTYGGFHAGDYAYFVIKDVETKQWISVRRKITKAIREDNKVSYEAFDLVAPESRVFIDSEVADYWIHKHS